MTTSVNNWLCKHFDVNEKGYVTIEDVKDKVSDILETFLICVVVGVVVVGAIYFMIRGILFILNDDIYTKIPQRDNAVEFIGVFLLIITFVFGLHLLYDRCKNVKIAKCKLKGEHERL